MSRFRWSMLLGALAWLACGEGAEADVKLTPEQRENLGIETVQLSRTAIPRAWQATAQVLDTAGLITNLSELRAARHALSASDAELRRVEALFRDDTNVSRRAVEAAASQRAADDAKVIAAEGQVRSTWGSFLVGSSVAAQDRLESDLRAAKVSLVRLDLATPLPAGLSRPEVELRSLDGAYHWRAEWLGELPRTSSATLGGTILVRAAASLVNGQLLAAEMREGKPSLSGVRVPSEAIVRWHGTEWFFVETANGEFVRRSLAGAPNVQGERLVSVESGDAPLRIVKTGARSLLTAELSGADEAGSDTKAGD